MERLMNICKELEEKNVIYGIEECNAHIKVSVACGGNKSTYALLKRNFSRLGYDVQDGGWSDLRIYYDNKEREIDEVFSKYFGYSSTP